MKSLKSNSINPERDLSPEIKRHADAAIFFMGVAVGGLCTAGLSLLIHIIRSSV